MKDKDSGASRQDKPTPAHQGAPVGTHSLTGGGAAVGMPKPPRADAGVEHTDREAQPTRSEGRRIAEIFGNKP